MSKMLSVVTAGALAALVASVATVRAEDQVDLKQVLRELAARQAQVQSLSCSWTTTTVFPAGALRVFDEDEQPVPGRFTPEVETHITKYARVILDGDRVAFRNESVQFFVGETTRPQDMSGVWSGGVAKELTGWADEEGSRGGMISAHTSFRAFSMFCPIRYAYRFFSPDLGAATEANLSFIGRSSVGEHPCVVVEAVEDEVVERWWLAEDMGYLPVQWQLLRQPDLDLAQQIVMHYEAGGAMGWSLKSWELTEEPSSSRVVTITSTSAVDDLAMNQPVPEEAFTLEFPSGTRVYNDFKGQMNVVE